MKRALIALFFFAATSAFAADTANLDFGTFNAGYEVNLTDLGLTGSQMNLGYGSGEVALKLDEGNWNGRFGFSQITSRSMKKRSETKMTYEFIVVPGGYYTAHIERKGEKVHVTLLLPNGETAQSALKMGKYLNGGNDIIAMDLTKRSDSTWKGTTSITYGRSVQTSPTELMADGALNPEVLASVDPALYVILYVLPYNYVK